MSISTCALREEGDLYIEAEKAGTEAFLSTPSARRATGHDRQEQAADGISIHALREEGDTRSRWSSGIRPISIHALREEGDSDERTVHRRFDPISIHALREEGDGSILASACRITIFLSTPSARRATRCFACCGYIIAYFYPRPPRGGRQVTSHKKIRGSGISIHALREEGDDRPLEPARADTISIHALREEGDGLLGGAFIAVVVFLSTPSARRATLSFRSSSNSSCRFLSTPSARRATSLRP